MLVNETPIVGGEWGAKATSALLALALLMTIAALSMTDSRVYEAMGRDCARLSAWLGRGRIGRRGPVASIALQAPLTIIAIAARPTVLLAGVATVLSGVIACRLAGAATFSSPAPGEPTLLSEPR